MNYADYKKRRLRLLSIGKPILRKMTSKRSEQAICSCCKHKLTEYNFKTGTFTVLTPYCGIGQNKAGIIVYLCRDSKRCYKNYKGES